MVRTPARTRPTGPSTRPWPRWGRSAVNDSAEAVIRANEICNRYGIDTISVGGAIAFAIECYENGLITKEETGGLELDWGNSEAVVALTEQIAKREGFGAVLADGSKRAAERIGKGSEQYAMHVGGRELPLHDPRVDTCHGCLLHRRRDAFAALRPPGYGPSRPGRSSGLRPAAAV